MFFIVEVQGCLPYVSFILNENGEPMPFDTKEEAIAFANENCAWEWRIVEF